MLMQLTTLRFSAARLYTETGSAQSAGTTDTESILKLFHSLPWSE